MSTASLILGVAAAGASASGVLVAGAAGLVAGAMSMAAGEYVSVSSQADTEEADLGRERKELAANDRLERAELAAIYVGRGLDADLARQVADQLMAHDALGAHARDELGILRNPARTPDAGGICFGGYLRRRSRPAAGCRASRSPGHARGVRGRNVAPLLAILGFLAARTGGARVAAGTLRVAFWGAIAMALTYGVGALFGTVV